MKTKTLIIAGALAALGYVLWRRQREVVDYRPAAETGMGGEEWG